MRSIRIFSLLVSPDITSLNRKSEAHLVFEAPAPAPAPVPTFGRDLLDDEEAEERQLKKTNDNNVEIANLRNQLSSTSTAQATVQHDRNQLEADLATSAATLTQIQTQLASAKIGYDTESKLLADLRERYTNQANEIKTTRDELIHAESDLSGLKLEKAEIGGNLLREKDDVRELKRRAAEIAQEVELIKKEIEQAKKDARMQKGLLAIAKKQLSTAEAEKEAAQKELAESKAEAEQAEAEVAQTEAAIATLKENTIVAPTSPPKVASPKPTGERDIATPGSPPVTSPILPFAESGRIASPTPSNSSRNPFDRFRQGSVSSLTTPQRSGSPFAAAHEPIAEAPKYSAEQDDPFGFNEPATEPPALILSPTIPTLTTGTETPRQQAAIPNGNLIAPMSPEQEKLISPAETFFTPPTSSAGNANIDDLFVDNNDTSASRFPALTDPISPTNDTDLPPLKDVVEEDSSSDEEDNRPLGEVKAEKQATAAISGGETQKHAPQESVNTGPSFDDVFGAPEPSAAATSATTTTAPNSHFSTLGSSAASPTTSAFNSQVAPPVINGHTTG
jgi:epidermal growth factor receptor substrate 15